jgi:hypothetical protein
MLVILHQFFLKPPEIEKKLNDTDPVGGKKGK